MRIAIIGAGPAGLMAAETLKEKGYTDVTLFERDGHAGGKCRSIEYQGSWHELGAGVLAENHRVVLDLAKKYRVETRLVDLSVPDMLLDTHGRSLPARSWRETIQLILQGLHYRRLVKKYERVTRPGLTNLPAELCIPFATWAKEHGIPLVTDEFAKYFTGFGYDYLEDVPAPYVLKYYSWETLWSAIRKKFYKFPGGIQNLWGAVAKQHRIVYHTKIKHITREKHVQIKTDAGEEMFDRLIITAPLDEALTYLSPRAEESELFSKIRWCDYRVFACVLEGFPKHTGYAPENYVRTRPGEPLFWYSRNQDSDLHEFYVLADWNMSDETIGQKIKTFIQPLGGNVKRIHTVAHWKYFPHVNAQDMREGYFDRLEALQGTHNTLYAGELLNFSTVEQSAWHAKTLVERFF